MTAYEFAAAPSSRTARAARRLLRVVADAWRALMNRRAFYRLGELSDAELADIGLTRADLHVAFDGPLGSDPTVRLRVIVHKRFDAVEEYARRVS